MTQQSTPSERWTTLVNCAVLGADRARLPADRGDRPWIVNDCDGDAAAAFLDETASLAVYELAGRSPSPVDLLKVPAFLADKRACSLQAGRQLYTILFGGKEAILGEWCEAAIAAGLVAPPELIPSLLTLARSTQEEKLRQSLLVVSGERGAWLAELNPEWRQSVAIDSPVGVLVELWESGERDERVAALTRLRETAPRLACQLLADTWMTEPAAERVRMLAVLTSALSVEDEPWLETCLDDRSKQVRGAAAELLSLLPDSGLSKRMASRVEEWVRLRPGSLAPRKQATIEFTAPDELDDASKRDSLEAKAIDGLGPKASLLRRLAALASLSAWAGASHHPADVIAAAAASEWTDALIQGWAEAASQQCDAIWAEAVLAKVCLGHPGKEIGIKNDWRIKQIEPLIRSLPRDTAERLACDALADGGPHTPGRHAEAALIACDFPWDRKLSEAAVEALSKRIAGSDVVYDQTIRQLLGIAAIRMKPSLADVVAREWTAKQDHWSTNFAQVVHAAVDTLRIRRDMLAALQETPLGV